MYSFGFEVLTTMIMKCTIFLGDVTRRSSVKSSHVSETKQETSEKQEEKRSPKRRGFSELHGIATR
jgi:hypothetical protein